MLKKDGNDVTNVTEGDLAVKQQESHNTNEDDMGQLNESTIEMLLSVLGVIGAVMIAVVVQDRDIYIHTETDTHTHTHTDL